MDEFSVLLVGNVGVGKTALFQRFIDNVFSETTVTTLGLNSMSKVIEDHGNKCTLRLSDTAGQERFRILTSSFYYRANAIVLVYDVTDVNSFHSITNWLREVNTYAPNALKILVGNKCDMLVMKQVDYELAKQFAEDNEMQFFETSCKDDINVDDVFLAIARLGSPPADLRVAPNVMIKTKKQKRSLPSSIRKFLSKKKPKHQQNQ